MKRQSIIIALLMVSPVVQTYSMELDPADFLRASDAEVLARLGVSGAFGETGAGQDLLDDSYPNFLDGRGSQVARLERHVATRTE